MLVIIGLIIGGILVGREMIQAAEIRAQVSQVEKYNAAANTFRIKYGYLPGDIQAAQASAFGFTTRSGIKGEGDGDGLLKACNYLAVFAGFYAGHSLGCETTLFWHDLSDANLIDGKFTGTNALNAYTTISQLESVIPRAKFANSFIAAISMSGAYTRPPRVGNYYYIGEITGQDVHGNVSVKFSITPLQAYDIDKKNDDGSPVSGGVQFRGQQYGYPGHTTTSIGDLVNIGNWSGRTGCVDETTNLYNYKNTNDKTCILIILGVY